VASALHAVWVVAVKREQLADEPTLQRNERGVGARRDL
jgi:hypothetical protein